MSQAENYALLFAAGQKAQAEKLAENMSIWKGQDWANEVTVFGFEDGSAIFASGPDFREASADEIAQYK